MTPPNLLLENYETSKGRNGQTTVITSGRTSIHLVVAGNIEAATLLNMINTSSFWRQRTF